MLSISESNLSLDKNVFQLTCIVSANDIRLSARTEVGQRQLLALVMGSGDLTFYYLSGESGQLPIMRRVPWFTDSNKKITALCFDPSGCWLLVTGYDGSIFIVPALSLVDTNAVLDHRWSTTDITSFSSPLLNTSNQSKPELHPTSVVWWHILLEGLHVAIVGTDSGDLIFVSLSTGFQVGITYVRAKVSMLHICQDNNLDSVFLLITSETSTQWKLLLEQRATGYAWPIDSSGSAVKVVTSNSELSSSSHNSLDLEYGNRSIPHLPTTRSRLQGLKQLSVEKLMNLRQRLAETRSKGAAAMAVNMHFRRESSGSSSDDTTGSHSLSGKQATADGTEAPVSHHVTTGPQPEKLSIQVGATFLCPQFAKGRDLLSGYYDPTSILTIHGMSLELVPLSVHKLAPNSRDVLVTDKFLYITDSERRNLSIVSCQLSESRLDGDAELNPDSIIETYRMHGENEKILSVYKRTDYRKRHSGGDSESVSKVTFEPKSRGSSRERKSSQQPFTLPKSMKDLKLDTPSVDTCVIVTSSGVYEISLRISPTEVFMDLVLVHQALEKAEKLALVFGLNLQQLLEGAGDLKLSGREFPQAIALYKLSRCRHLKSVLKFAAGGHAAELLSYITLLFSTSGIDLTTSERIHLSNLAVMSYTEQILRAASGKVILLKQFLKFLRENLYYDEVLAVNVAGQTGLWELLQFLASYRGLHPEVLDILTKIVKSLGEGLLKSVENKTTGIDIKNLPAFDSGLWLCISDPSLLQSLLAKPQQARVHLQYVRTCLPHLEQFALQRLAALYDPSSPQLRPGLKRMFKLSRRRERSSGSYGSYSIHLDSLYLLDPVDELFVPCEDIVQTFLLVLLYLAKKRQATSAMYMPELMEKIQLAKDDDEDSEELCPSLPVHTNSLSAGFSHVALVRNGAIYTWGNAVQGCLGTGPLMSRYSCAQQVSLMPNLKLEVISVSCGRQHTLALTNNGVYAWGSSQFGQLGIGKTGQSSYPRLVEQLCRERIIAVAAGQYHSIALADDGRVFTWGWGVHGQLGHKSVEDCHTPCLVERLIGKVVIQICGGHGHTLVLTAEGQVYTFGSSVFGQLGNGSNTKSSVPVHVASLTERITLIATSYFHNLTVSSTNKLYIWGSSPQVLRLQAQAQKKARLLQQQQNISAPSSPARNAQIKPELDSQEPSSTYHNPTFIDSELPVASSQTSQPMTADKCQRNQPDTITLGTKKVNTSHIPITVNDPDVYTAPRSESSTSVFSDFENANVGKSSGRASPHVSARRDHNLDLQVKAKYTTLATTDEAYSMPTLIVSPTMEFKGLTASRSPVENNFDSGEIKSNSQSVKSDGIDDIQPHLLPQLIDTSLVVGPITQISCGCHHSALLTRDGVLYMWGRNLDGQLGNGTRKEIVKPSPLSSPPPPGASSSKGSSQTSGMQRSPSLSGIVTGGDKLRFRQVSCGCEFTVAQENTSTGKLWAWGNNSQAQLGHAPVEDSKPLEGKFVMLKTTKRVIKLPHGSQNSSDLPKEVPGLPSSTITFKYDNMSGIGGWYDNCIGTSTELCPPLCSIEEPCYGLRTLHYAFQHFHGYYDSPYLSNKCLELENYQGAAKLAALERHYHLALAYQLKALALSSEENAFDLEKHIDTQCTNFNREISEKISNFKKDLITNTANANKTKKASTNTSEVSNGAKDTNFNPLIVDSKDNSQISITNGNSNYTELNENTGTNTSGITKIEENISNHTSSENKDLKASPQSNGVSLMPNDKKTESEKDTKDSTEEVENRNKRNSEIHSNFAKSKANEVPMNDNSREKSRVGFAEKIHTHDGIESSNKTVDSISDMGVKPPEGKAETSPSDDVTEEINTSSSISTPESLASTNAQDSEMHAFAVQGGTEQMSEGHRYLTSPDSSTSPLASEEQSLQSPEPFLPQETPCSSDINLVPITSNGDLQNKDLEETIIKCEADSTVSGYETKESKNSEENISNPVIGDNIIPMTHQYNNETDSASNKKKDGELLNEAVDISSDSQNNKLQESKSSEMLNRYNEDMKTGDMNRTLEPTSLNSSFQIERAECTEHQQPEKESTLVSDVENKSLPSHYSKVEISQRVSDDALNSRQTCSDRTDLENYENELKDIDKESPVAGEVVKPSEVTRSGEKSDLRSDSVEKSDVEGPASKDLVAQAGVIVEYYVSVMEEDSHTMMSRLLQQGIEFWLSHSLPVDSLEQLLLKHMSKFFYPLGLLLFCKESSTGEEAERQQAASMLNHLSTRFSLQLCSSLLSHIDQKRAYPEYIELLAQITSIQASPSVNGCCISNQGLAQSPEQLMEAILEGLGAMKGFGGSLGQSYINFQEEESDSCKDSSSEAEKLEQLLAFSCGHRYGRSVFHQSVLPELELGLLQLHHPLPNTAKVLKGLFDSNSPNLHLACPRCVLGYLQSQTTPPL